MEQSNNFGITVEDHEYLKRPLIDNIQWELSEDKIRVYCEHTLFIECSRPAVLNRTQLLNSYNEALHLARQTGVKVRYSRHCKRFITENWKEYKVKAERYLKLFDEILEDTLILKSRGIHKGCRDDIYLNRLSDKVNILNARNYRHSVTDMMEEVCFHITRTIHILQNINVFRNNKTQVTQVCL